MASRSILSTFVSGCKEQSNNDPTAALCGVEVGKERRLQHKGAHHSAQDLLLNK